MAARKAGSSKVKKSSASHSEYEYKSLSGKLITSEPKRNPLDAPVWQVEKHSTTSGTLDLAFDARSRMYLAARVAGSTVRLMSPDRPGIMSALRKLSAVPMGWENIYGRNN